MYIVRDIFHLKFGHYREAKALMPARAGTDGDEAKAKNMFPEAITTGMSHPDFQIWYSKFKEHVVSSHREILKVIV